MTVNITDDDGVREDEESGERSDEVRRAGGSRRNVDVGDVEAETRDVDVDDDAFGDAVVDGRWNLDVADGMVDESKETSTAADSILSDNGEAGKRRRTRV